MNLFGLWMKFNEMTFFVHVSNVTAQINDFRKIEERSSHSAQKLVLGTAAGDKRRAGVSITEPDSQSGTL